VIVRRAFLHGAFATSTMVALLPEDTPEAFRLLQISQGQL